MNTNVPDTDPSAFDVLLEKTQKLQSDNDNLKHLVQIQEKIIDEYIQERLPPETKLFQPKMRPPKTPICFRSRRRYKPLELTLVAS